MAVRWHILIIGGRRAVVAERDTVEVLEVRVQEALISPIKRHTALGQGRERVKVGHIRVKHHDPAVETVRPANVRRGSKVLLNIKKLIWSAEGDNVSIDVHNLAKLALPPEIDLGKSGLEVPSVHQVKVGQGGIGYSLDGNDVVVELLDSRELHPARSREPMLHAP